MSNQAPNGLPLAGECGPPLPGKATDPPCATSKCSYSLEIHVATRKGALPGWRYLILGQGPPKVGSDSGELVHIPNGKDVTLRILPPAPRGAARAWEDDPSAYWPIDLRITSNGCAPSVEDPYHQVDVTKALDGLRLRVWMSRVRNIQVTLESADTLARGRSEDRSKETFAGNGVTGSTQLLDSTGKIIRTNRASKVSPDDLLVLFEIAPPRKTKGATDQIDPDFRPKLVGTHVGTDVAQADLLVYYYPQIDQVPELQNPQTAYLKRDVNQNDPDDASLTVNRYPGATDHIKTVFLGKLYYFDPGPWAPRSQFRAGLAHQVAAAERNVGIVIPFPDLQPKAIADPNTSLMMGEAIRPEALNEILLEIWGYVSSARLRKTSPQGTVGPLRQSARIGRVMVAAFSNGNHFLMQFTKNLAKSANATALPFREFCSLDPPPIYQSVEQTVREACSKLPDSRMHFYWKYTYNVATTDQGSPTILKGGLEVYKRVLEGRFHYAHLPQSAWPEKMTRDLDIHGWIDATMVCDALLSSAFPPKPPKASGSP